MKKIPNKISFAYQNPLKARLTQDFFAKIPETPGVYFMLDSSDHILYIGKAKNLKARIISYTQAKAGRAEEKTLELVEHIKNIRWEIHKNERLALQREGDLIRTLRPIYNVAGTEKEIFLYLGLKKIVPFRTSQSSQFELRLSHWPTTLVHDGFQLYGAFQHRSKIKFGYSALLRLLHIYQYGGPRFYYPSKISRVTPPWIYQTHIPQELEVPFYHFLRGINLNFIRIILMSLLENDQIPKFMTYSIQEDINAVRALFKYGPSTTLRLKKSFGLTSEWISPEQMQKIMIKKISPVFQ